MANPLNRRLPGRSDLNPDSRPQSGGISEGSGGTTPKPSVAVVLTVDLELFDLIKRAATVRGVPSVTYMRDVLAAQAHIDVAEYAVTLSQCGLKHRRPAQLSSPQVQAALSALLDALASPKE